MTSAGRKIENNQIAASVRRKRGTKMPRLDNGNQQVINAFELVYDPEDPGDTPPIDLCDHCARAWNDALFCEHPRYEDIDRRCFECGDALTEYDNWRPAGPNWQ